jgi:hypothetical protein
VSVAEAFFARVVGALDQASVPSYQGMYVENV